jgi:hypothetical protein
MNSTKTLNVKFYFTVSYDTVMSVKCFEWPYHHRPQTHPTDFGSHSNRRLDEEFSQPDQYSRPSLHVHDYSYSIYLEIKAFRFRTTCTSTTLSVYYYRLQ